MASLQEKLSTLIQPVVEGMGLEFVGLRYLPQGKYAVLRVYIDHPEGVLVEHCSAISHQISGVLDVEDPISSQYSLEVSSPGLDRPLFSLAHFARFIGEKVQLKFVGMVDGRRKLTGVIQAVEGEEITVEEQGEQWEILFSQIESAHLVPQFT